MSVTSQRLLIIADDLTGAADTGAAVRTLVGQVRGGADQARGWRDRHTAALTVPVRPHQGSWSAARHHRP